MRGKIVSLLSLAVMGTAFSAHAAQAGQAAASMTPVKPEVSIPGEYDSAHDRFTPSVKEPTAAAKSFDETITFTPIIAYVSRPASDYSSVQCSISTQYNGMSSGTATAYFTAGKKPTPISINIKFSSSSATNGIELTLMCSAYAILNEGHNWATQSTVTPAKNGALGFSPQVRF